MHITLTYTEWLMPRFCNLSRVVEKANHCQVRKETTDIAD